MDTRRMCPHCRAFITTNDRVCPYCNERVGPRAIDLRNPAGLLGGLIPHARATTVIFMTINFALYLATVAYSMKAGNGAAFMNLDVYTLVRFGSTYRPYVTGGQWWRVVTAGFLHGGLFHIGMNMWALMDLGAQVEEVYGTSRFVVIYLVSSAGGFILSTIWSGAPSVGASAALFGLIGAMIALGTRSRTSMGAAIRGAYIRYAVYGLLIGFLSFFHIDNAAHIGGLATGFAAAYIAGTPRIESAPQEQFWRVAAWVAVAGTAYCFLKMYLSFSMQLH